MPPPVAQKKKPDPKASAPVTVDVPFDLRREFLAQCATDGITPQYQLTKTGWFVFIDPSKPSGTAGALSGTSASQLNTGTVAAAAAVEPVTVPVVPGRGTGVHGGAGSNSPTPGNAGNVFPGKGSAASAAPASVGTTEPADSGIVGGGKHSELHLVGFSLQSDNAYVLASLIRKCDSLRKVRFDRMSIDILDFLRLLDSIDECERCRVLQISNHHWRFSSFPSDVDLESWNRSPFFVVRDRTVLSAYVQRHGLLQQPPKPEATPITLAPAPTTASVAPSAASGSNQRSVGTPSAANVTSSNPAPPSTGSTSNSASRPGSSAVVPPKSQPPPTIVDQQVASVATTITPSSPRTSSTAIPPALLPAPLAVFTYLVFRRMLTLRHVQHCSLHGATLRPSQLLTLCGTGGPGGSGLITTATVPAPVDPSASRIPSNALSLGSPGSPPANMSFGFGGSSAGGSSAGSGGGQNSPRRSGPVAAGGSNLRSSGSKASLMSGSSATSGANSASTSASATSTSSSASASVTTTRRPAGPWASMLATEKSKGIIIDYVDHIVWESFCRAVGSLSTQAAIMASGSGTGSTLFSTSTAANNSNNANSNANNTSGSIGTVVPSVAVTGAALGDSEMAVLGLALISNLSIRSLSLRDNKISAAGWRTLSETLSWVPTTSDDLFGRVLGHYLEGVGYVAGSGSVVPGSGVDDRLGGLGGGFTAIPSTQASTAPTTAQGKRGGIAPNASVAPVPGQSSLAGGSGLGSQGLGANLGAGGAGASALLQKKGSFSVGPSTVNSGALGTGGVRGTGPTGSAASTSAASGNLSGGGSAALSGQLGVNAQLGAQNSAGVSGAGTSTGSASASGADEWWSSVPRPIRRRQPSGTGGASGRSGSEKSPRDTPDDDFPDADDSLNLMNSSPDRRRAIAVPRPLEVLGNRSLLSVDLRDNPICGQSSAGTGAPCRRDEISVGTLRALTAQFTKLAEENRIVIRVLISGIPDPETVAATEMDENSPWDRLVLQVNKINSRYRCAASRGASAAGSVGGFLAA